VPAGKFPVQGDFDVADLGDCQAADLDAATGRNLGEG
jgi:hypothetical protein